MLVSRIGGAFVAVVIAAGAGGCASSVDRRADAWGGEGAAAAQTRRGLPATHPSQGGSWELVFPTPGVNARLADAQPGPEYGRLDAGLNPRSTLARTAIDDWPQGPRPDLARARSVRIRDRRDTFIYYFPTRDHRGSSGDSARSAWWY